MSAKRFLLIFAIVYMAGAGMVNAFLGPPGMSSSFLEEYGQQYDLYLEIVKSTDYKLHQQNPTAHPADERLQERIAFVEEFELEDAYEAEMDRRAWYLFIIDVWNTAALVFLAGWFGAGPLLKFLDDQINEVRERIDEARQSRELSESELAKAKARLSDLERDKGEILEQGETLVKKTITDLDAGTELILEHMRQEIEDRKRLEEQRAKMQLKAELVNQALDMVEQRLREEAPNGREKALVDRFVDELEKSR